MPKGQQLGQGWSREKCLPERKPKVYSHKEPTCQRRRCKKRKFSSWGGKIPWRRAWQPTPVFLPGEFYGQRSLVGYSPWGRKESDITPGDLPDSGIGPGYSALKADSLPFEPQVASLSPNQRILLSRKQPPGEFGGGWDWQRSCLGPELPPGLWPQVPLPADVHWPCALVAGLWAFSPPCAHPTLNPLPTALFSN